MSDSDKPTQRPDLTYGLTVCPKSLIHYDALLATMSHAELQEYATRRLLRDYYLSDPKQLARDLHFYQEHYAAWWEHWRNQRR